MIELFTDPVLMKEFLIDKGWKLLLTIVTIIISYFIIKIMDKLLGKLFDKTEWDVALEKFLQSLANGVAWIIVMLIILTIFEFDLGPMVASLGIAGFVLGFALKDTLGNLASGVMILIYKPFTVGHFVEINSIMGTMKHVGISACTIDTPDNKRVTIPNSLVWGNAITNYSANATRRVDIPVGISYSDDIATATKIAQDLLKKDALVLNDPEPLVVVDNLGDSSVNLILRFWVKKDDYLSQKFGITRAIKEAFDHEGISIPFPQRDLHIIESKPSVSDRKVTMASRKKLNVKKYEEED